MLRCGESSWPTALPRGVIHADLFPDNVFFLAGKLSGLIDFYFACVDAFVYDVAIAVNDWCTRDDATLDDECARVLDELRRGREQRPFLRPPDDDAARAARAWRLISTDVDAARSIANADTG